MKEALLRNRKPILDLILDCVVASPCSQWSARIAACGLSVRVQDPVAEGSVETQGSEFGVELGGNNSVEC